MHAGDRLAVSGRAGEARAAWTGRRHATHEHFTGEGSLMGAVAMAYIRWLGEQMSDKTPPRNVDHTTYRPPADARRPDEDVSRTPAEAAPQDRELTKSDDQLKKEAEEHEPARHGDVLGITDADPAVEIPRATTDRSGNPKGIDVRDHASGMDEMGPTESGAVGVDLGGSGKPSRT
jgi:hypothetical protein